MVTFRNLRVWRRAIALAKAVYEVSDAFPKEEGFGLTSQVRRAAVSVASNIAEGHGRKSQLEFCQFLSNARGSTAEVETQLILARELGFIRQPELTEAEQVAGDCYRMLDALMAAVKERIARQSKKMTQV